MGGHKIINQNNVHFLTMTTVGWVDVFSRKAEEHAKGISVSTPMGTGKSRVRFNFPGDFAKALEKWLTNRQQK